MTTHDVHADHDHRHGPGCGHESMQHNDHVDYLHDGHRHVEHEDHWDECTPADSPDRPTERAVGAL